MENKASVALVEEDEMDFADQMMNGDTVNKKVEKKPDDKKIVFKTKDELYSYMLL